MAQYGFAEQGPIDGHENLTMADQMRARNQPSRMETSPIDGAVRNPRREYIKNRVQAYAKQAMKSTTGETL